MTTQLTKAPESKDDHPPTRALTFPYTAVPGYKGTEDATDHYLRQIRNAVVFLAVLAGIGVVGGVIMGVLIALNTAPHTSLY